jgi:hypothetical protein
MKTKVTTAPLIFNPTHIKEPRPSKSVRPTRSMSGVKSLRPKNLPMVAAEISKTVH